jgi:hypothetical protein
VKSDRPSRKQAKALRLEEQRAAETEWNCFPGLPGRHLEWRNAGSTALYWRGLPFLTYRNPVLTDQNGAVIAETHVSLGLKTIRVEGGLYRIRGLKRSNLKQGVREITETATGTAIVRIDGAHFARCAGTVAELLPDSRRLTFPVRGSLGRSQTLMKAIDEAGATVLQFRSTTKKSVEGVETVVAPDKKLTPALICVICVAPSLLRMYFDQPGMA